MRQSRQRILQENTEDLENEIRQLREMLESKDEKVCDLIISLLLHYSCSLFFIVAFARSQLVVHWTELDGSLFGH